MRKKELNRPLLDENVSSPPIQGVTKQIGFVTGFDDTQIYYESRGQGEPVVLIYGICCQMNHWHHQIEYLSKQFRVITFDLRGHHKSGTPIHLENLTIEAVAKDVESLCQHLALKKIHFVGHSYGVPVLIQLHKINPQMAKTYSFINGFAKNPLRGMFGMDIVEPLFYFIKSQHSQTPKLLSEIWKYATNNPLAMALSVVAGGFNFKLTEFKDIEIYARGVSQTPLHTLLHFFEDMMTFDGTDILETINVPTLIITGDRDAVTPLKFQQTMQSLIKTNHYLVVPYGSHCVHLDFPDYINLKLEIQFNSPNSK